MSVEQNKDLVLRWVEEVWNAHNPDAVADFVASDYVRHDPSGPEVHGPASEKQLVAMYLAAFPDLRFEVDDILAEGDRVAARKVATGTHRGELQGIPPTGRSMKVEMTEIYRIERGRIAEQWVMLDNLGMLRQLGVVE